MAGVLQTYWDKLKDIKAKKKAERAAGKKKEGGKKKGESMFSAFKAAKDIKKYKERNRKILESMRK
jgi:hypothetical protein